MTAALATLAFLATLWLLVVVGAMVFEQSGAKIIPALKRQSIRGQLISGQSMEPAITTAPVRHRERERTAYRAPSPYAAPARRCFTRA